MPGPWADQEAAAKRAAEIHEMALQAYDRGKPDLAAQLWNQIIGIGFEPAIPTAVHNIGMVRLEAGDLEMAKKCFIVSAAKSRFPAEASMSLIELGKIAARQQDLEAAHRFWASAEEVNPACSGHVGQLKSQLSKAVVESRGGTTPPPPTGRRLG